MRNDTDGWVCGGCLVLRDFLVCIIVLGGLLWKSL